MKKQTLLLLAGGMLAFASCNNNAPAGGGMSQEQVDSAVNVRVEEMRMQLTAQNDSLINVMAQAKADSMIAAMKSGAPAPSKTVKNTPKPPAKTTQPAQPVNTNPKADRFNGTDSKSNKDSRFNENAAQKQAEQNASKKSDRFK